MRHPNVMDLEPFIELTLVDTPEAKRLDGRRVLTAVRETLRRFGPGCARISVAMIGDDRMARLNAEFLGHEGPTDVLSFDLRDEQGPDGYFDLDGELVISVDTAEREARCRGHAPLDEAMLYAVHGTLHLLGYDDHDAASSAVMHDLEDDVLAALGVCVEPERVVHCATTPECSLPGGSRDSASQHDVDRDVRTDVKLIPGSCHA